MTYLYLWVTLAVYSSSSYMSWVNAGSYDSPAACVTAVRSLGVDVSKVRCVQKGSGESVPL